MTALIPTPTLPCPPAAALHCPMLGVTPGRDPIEEILMHDDGRRGGDHEGGEIVVTVRSWLERIETKLDQIAARQERDASGLNARMGKVEQDILVHISQPNHLGGSSQLSDIESRLRMVEQQWSPRLSVLETLANEQQEMDARLRRTETRAVTIEQLNRFGWAVLTSCVMGGIALLGVLVNLVSKGVHP